MAIQLLICWVLLPGFIPSNTKHCCKFSICFSQTLSFSLSLSLYIYIYIYIVIKRLFRCITTLQCSLTCEILQAGIETRLTLRRLDILPKSHRHSQDKCRNFLRIIFYINVIGYLARSILEKSFCISALCGCPQISPLETSTHTYIYCHSQTHCFIESQLLSVARPAAYIYIYIYICVCVCGGVVFVGVPMWRTAKGNGYCRRQ